MTTSMESDTKRKIQLFLAAAIAIAALRAAYIFYERRSEEKQSAQPKQDAPLMADYYITPRKLRPYDLKSAKELANQPAWVKEGYKYSFYPYEAAKKRTDFSREAGTLGPIEKLQITDVVTDVAPRAAGQRQLMALFEKDGKTYAVPIGSVKDGNYQIYSDEMFYIQDPRELYKHWTSDVWQSIERHEVQQGMNELQADFAIGMGMPQTSMDSTTKTVRYPNGGKPLTVVYRNGKAAEVKPET
jgi:hypothetical protein